LERNDKVDSLTKRQDISTIVQMPRRLMRNKKSRTKSKRKKIRIQENSNPEGLNLYRVAFLGIIAIALYLRLSFVFKAHTIPFNFMSDSNMYMSWAMSIIEGKEFVKVFHNAPLYPYFIAAIFRLFGTSMLSVLLIQAILGTLNCLLVYGLTLKLFKNKWIGIIAFFATAIYGPMIFYDGMVLMATLVTFVNLVFLIVLLKAVESNDLKYWGTSGVLFGISALGRGTILLFVPLLACFLIFKAWSENRKKTDESNTIPIFIRSCIYPLSAFLLTAFIVISPVTLRNYIKGNDFVLIAGNAGITFYSGNNALANGRYMDPPGLDLGFDFNGSKIVSYLEKRELRPSEVSAYWFREAWKFIKDNPTQYVKLLGKKFGLFWNYYEIPNAENYYFSKQYSRILQLPLLTFLMVSGLSILGIAMCIWRGNSGIYIVLLFLLSYMASIVGFFVTSRYRIPIVPVMISFMGYFVVTFIREAKGKKYKRVLLWICCGVIAFVFVTLPWKVLSQERDYAASYVNVGRLYVTNKNHQKACDYFRLAIKTDSEYVKAYNNLGASLYELGRKEDAMRYWKRGLETDPDYGLIHVNLGNMYQEEGQLEKARAEYSVAERLRPYSIKLKIILDQLKENGI
jgi:tetratricopeptide (TPR) repeat protein